MSQPLFFSIVVPAHNEEGYIGKTLASVAASEYPEGSYEMIVVENGSTDETYEAARLCSKMLPSLRVFQEATPGISHARNRGIRELSEKAQWVVFLDADTYMDSGFLSHLNTFIQKPRATPLGIGTASLQPWPGTAPMQFIYFFSNIFCVMFRSTYGGACFVRRDILTSEQFDEKMQVGEDAEFTNRAKKHGQYFFLRTRLVYTSTRRFVHNGWKQIPVYLGMGLVAEFAPKMKSSFVYKVIR